jgi:hypothetical protein
VGAVVDKAVCAYCQTEMDRITAARCPDCDAVHHQDCWQDNGGCAVLGCAAGPDATAPDQTTSAPVMSTSASTIGLPVSPPPWSAGNASLTSTEANKRYCTQCGQDLAGSAAFCIKCGEPTAVRPGAREGAATSLPAEPPGPAWTIPMPAWREATAKVSSPGNRTKGIAAVTVVLLAAAAFFVFGAAGERHTVTGSMSLTTGSDLTTGASCEGSGGYSDVASGTQVVIEDDSGKTLATSEYGPGVFDGTSCVFEFTFNDVAKSAFYRVHSGSNRGVVQYSYKQMVDNNWSVSLTLGDG